MLVQAYEELQASNKPEYLGPGTLSRAEYARCDGHFYLHKKEPKGGEINIRVVV